MMSRSRKQKASGLKACDECESIDGTPHGNECSRGTKGSATLELGDRIRLRGTDAENWELELLRPVTHKGQTRMSWIRLGYYSHTAAGLSAAVRHGFESDLRTNGGELNSERFAEIHDRFLVALEVMVSGIDLRRAS